jgi:DNA-directed RNA polymerase subunit RPC12/RpoP
MDKCIRCGEELAIMERNRAECWDCRDKTIEAYTESDDHGV